jgi:enoyl-CoA hydratase/carnithine racemase
VTTQLAQAPFVAVAVLQGLALGGGLELALACDLRLAAKGASLGLPESRVGTIPGAGGTQRLPRLIGTSRALALMLTGEAVDAAQALQMGLIHAVHPRGELDAAALELGNVLAARSPRALQAVRRLVREGTGMPVAAALEMEREVVGEMLASPDYAEGLAAFTQKRPPHFA